MFEGNPFEFFSPHFGHVLHSMILYHPILLLLLKYTYRYFFLLFISPFDSPMYISKYNRVKTLREESWTKQDGRTYDSILCETSGRSSSVPYEFRTTIRPPEPTRVHALHKIFRRIVQLFLFFSPLSFYLSFLLTQSLIFFSFFLLFRNSTTLREKGKKNS